MPTNRSSWLRVAFGFGVGGTLLLVGVFSESPYASAAACIAALLAYGAGRRTERGEW